MCAGARWTYGAGIPPLQRAGVVTPLYDSVIWRLSQLALKDMPVAALLPAYPDSVGVCMAAAQAMTKCLYIVALISL